MDKKINKFIYWAPRILSIIFVIFLMMFSLDVFEPGLTFGQIALGLFMHNIPALILLIILIISWKYEIVGGVTFILASILHIIFSLTRMDAEPWYISFTISLIVGAPAFLVGILFLIGWFEKRKIAVPPESSLRPKL